MPDFPAVFQNCSDGVVFVVVFVCRISKFCLGLILTEYTQTDDVVIMITKCLKRQCKTII